MWVFSKNTIAGDLGVTPIVQCLMSMLITSTLVHTDLHSHAIQPLPFVYPHVEHLPDPLSLFGKAAAPSTPDEEIEKRVQETKKGFRHYYLMLLRFIFEGTEKNMMLAKIPISHWFGRLGWTIAQGAAIGIIFGLPLWCLAIVILGPIYGTGNMGNKWAPQVIKAVYGAIVGWITNPVIATLALGSQAESHLLVVEHDEEEGGMEGAGTIPEDEEVLASPTLRPPPASPGVSTSRQLSTLPVPSTPTSIRPRSGSNASRISRPPLTANVSQLSPLPSTAILPPSPSPGVFTRPRGPSVSVSVTGRPRGATVSSQTSNRSYSYALGGTGGRAQRPRAASRATATGIPTLFLPTEGGGEESRNLTMPIRPPGSPARPAAWDVFGRNDSAPISPQRRRESRRRAQSAAELNKSSE